MSHQVGEILCGKYALEASIGKGGMGEVFAARDLGTGDRVAVKVVNRGLFTEVLMARLHREAVAAGRIRSDYVPRVLEVARTGEDDELCMVMELLLGESLSQRLRRRGGNLTWDEVRRLGADILQGLIDAHAAGVVHRDLKPGNIFIEEASDSTERGKVLDFGVCKLDAALGDNLSEHLTTTGEALGTVAYMAPEQIRGASKVDERADVYSFAMVVFEALSGRLAYDATGSMALIASKLETPARSLRGCAVVAVPAALDGLLARALSRKPGDRVSSAAAMLEEWRALGEATEVPQASVSGSAMIPVSLNTNAGNTDAAITEAETGTLATTKVAKASRLGLAAATIALLAASMLLVFVLSGHASSAGQAPSVAIAHGATVAEIALPAVPVVVAAVASAAPEPLTTDASAPRARPLAPTRAAAPASPRSGAGEPHITETPRY